jgi:hypothetical protein
MSHLVNERAEGFPRQVVSDSQPSSVEVNGSGVAMPSPGEIALNELDHDSDDETHVPSPVREAYDGRKPIRPDSADSDK